MSLGKYQGKKDFYKVVQVMDESKISEKQTKEKSKEKSEKSKEKSPEKSAESIMAKLENIKEIPKCETKSCSDVTFKTVQEYLDHSKEKHNRNLICEECFKCYATPQSLKKHLKKTHNFVQKFQCDRCETVIRSEYHMKLHFQGSHPDENCSYSLIKGTFINYVVKNWDFFY